jgi:hypothetical protein
MKYVYIIDYWITFPSSEYGGIVICIGETDLEVFELLINEDSFPESNNVAMMESIKNATKLALKDEYESGIIEAFTT